LAIPAAVGPKDEEWVIIRSFALESKNKYNLQSKKKRFGLQKIRTKKKGSALQKKMQKQKAIR
jgi:hypothetical protein